MTGRYGVDRSLLIGRNRPIVLKKSAMVSTAEKYAREIEIFTFEQRIAGSDLA